MTHSRRCPCSSRKLYSNCCEKYLGMIPGLGADPKETVLLEWLERYAPPIAQEFMRKARTYIFRISWLLQSLLERYFDSPVVRKNGRLETKDEPICCIEHNTLLCLFGALSCLEQGLFIQSGILLRSVLENCFVLVDISENKGQIERILKDKYSVNGLLGRTKLLLPECLVDWYGYFSRNFAHFGPIHPAPYTPGRCWPDNMVLVTGIQNVVRGFVGFGIVLERLHFDQAIEPVFWNLDPKNGDLTFDEQKSVWEWIKELGKEAVAKYPPKERKEGFIYTEKTYKLK